MSSRYRATINGFWCRNETWDDALNWDGKHDEVFLDVNTKVLDANGTVLQSFDSESELMGDTWRLPNRIQAGSASDRGGIISGDKFPNVPNPWQRVNGLNTERFPPYTIWEGDLRPGQDMVLLTPTIWEWDPGTGMWDGWLEWIVQVDNKFGARAKEIFGGIWPVSKPVFDAVSLGIQTVGTAAGIWSPLGQSVRRPIGTRRNPDDPDGVLFNPGIIALNTDTANYLSSSNLQGYGTGIVELRYADDPYLRGVYSIFVQVEKLSNGGELSMQPNWRWCDKCQSLFHGPGVAASRCPAGGTHRPPEESRSGNYSLPHNVAADPSRQGEWRWCNKCQGLFHGPGLAVSRCAAGGTHAPQDQSGSGNYSLPHNVPEAPDRQSEWRWCNKCQSLFFGPGVVESRCPAGDTHMPPAQSGSGNYSLPHKHAA